MLQLDSDCEGIMHQTFTHDGKVKAPNYYAFVPPTDCSVVEDNLSVMEEDNEFAPARDSQNILPPDFDTWTTPRKSAWLLIPSPPMTTVLTDPHQSAAKSALLNNYYMHYVAPGIEEVSKSFKWTKTMDNLMMRKLSKGKPPGDQWGLFAMEHFPCHTGTDVYNRYKTLRRPNIQDPDGDGSTRLTDESKPLVHFFANTDNAFVLAVKGIGGKIYNVNKQGNCMFESLAHQMHDDTARHVEVRRNVIRFMELNESWFQHGRDLDVSFQTHCSEMKKDGIWGGHLELRAAAGCYDVKIVVLRPRSLSTQDEIVKIVITWTEECNPDRTLWLS